MFFCDFFEQNENYFFSLFEGEKGGREFHFFLYFSKKKDVL